MIALFGAGTVEKHPLTDEVIITRPTLLAKAQLGSPVDGRWPARVLWSGPGSRLVAGMDAIPLPGEAAPNSPPLSAGARPTSAAQGATVAIELPVQDPDGDPLTVRWSLDGTAGRVGTLLETSTLGGRTSWIAPVGGTTATIIADVTDPLGQATRLNIPVTLTAPGEARDRRPTAWSTRGDGVEPGLLHLTRDPTGSWWGITAPVGLTGSAGLVILPGHFGERRPVAYGGADVPKKPVGIACRAGEAHVLDAGRGLVTVYGADGSVRRTYGTFDKALDLALGHDGTAFIADGADLGIHVHEPDGRYRCRLGRGAGEDALLALAAVAVDGQDTVIALDPQRPALLRFDRFGRRLETWACPGDAKDTPIDVVCHPRRGALVLLSSGRVFPVGDQGLGESLPDPALAAGIPTPGAAVSLALDAAGTLIAIHQDGTLRRWSPDLQPAGVAGSHLRTGDAWAADGQGRTFALDRASASIAITDAEGWQTARLPIGAQRAQDLAVSSDGRWLAITDTKACQALRLDLQAPTRPAVPLGAKGKYDGQFQEPSSLTFDGEGRLYVLDVDLQRVVVFLADGTYAFQINGGLEDPEFIAVSPSGDRLYVYDSDNYEIKRFAVDHSKKSGTPDGRAGGKGSGPGQLRSVIGLGCDRQGLLAVLDDSREDVQILDYRGAACQHILSIDQKSLGLTDLTALAVHPDGPLVVAGAGRVVHWRW
jgi:sugar lactone lactonase YvrE